MPLNVPTVGRPDPVVLTPITDDVMAGNALAAGGVGASATYPTASTALFFPVRLTQPRTYVKAFWVNGTAVAGNVDVGIYTISGTTATRVVASTAEAQATVSAVQIPATFASTTIGPGLYYLAMSCTSITSQFWRMGPNFNISRQLGFFQAASQSPLPASCTVVAVTANSYVPSFGFSEQSVV